MLKNNSLFNLSNLINISGNDLEFVRETIDMAIYTIPESIEQIELSFVQNDLELLKKSVHEIKPIMIMFDHSKIRSLNAQIEQSSSYSEIKNIVPELTDLLQEFIIDLKMER